jgi:hypothetical protein
MNVHGHAPHRFRHWLTLLPVLAVLALAALLALPRPIAPEPALSEQVKDYFAAREAQARSFAAQEGKAMAPEVWPFFAAGRKGDWHTMTNLYFQLAKRSYQFDNAQVDERLTSKAWQCINESFRAYEQLALAEPRYSLFYAHELTNAIPPGGVLFAGTDTGRFLPTLFASSFQPQTSLFIVSLNQLADGLYLDYLQNIYTNRLHTPSNNDFQQTFQDYVAAASRRYVSGQLKAGELYSNTNNQISVNGMTAIMEINARLTRVLFDQNPDREFFADPAFPIEWMYPHLIPEGVVFKLNRTPLEQLPEDALKKDHDFWERFLARAIGPWVNRDTTVAEICDFTERVCLRRDYTGFTGDPAFVRSVQGWQELPAQRSAAKMFATRRAHAASIFVWRSNASRSRPEQEPLLREADFAYRQGLALCANVPEVVFGYVNLLRTLRKHAEALRVAETALKLDPENDAFRELVSGLASQAKQPAP